MAGKFHPKQLAQAGATNGQVLTYNTSSGLWGPAPSSVGSQKADAVTIINGTNPYMSTSSSTYVLAADCVFRGTSVMGTPSGIKVIAWADSGAVGGVQIYDLTNAKVIAESLSINTTTKALFDLGTLSNLPAGAAMWEVRLKRASGSGSMKVFVSAEVTEY